MDAIFVDGEPVLSGGRGQESWQEAIRAGMSDPPLNPSLTFVVSGLRRRGHPFDLDNLVHPVLMVLDEPVDQVSASLHVGARPGLLMEDHPVNVPPSGLLRSLYVDSHSETSDRSRKGVPEIADEPLFDAHEGLGLALEFDRSDIPIRRGWFGPTEAVVDDLTPWFGTYTKRGLIADHRIRDLRIVRGINPERSGVRISLWYVPDSSIPVPDVLQARIDSS